MNNWNQVSLQEVCKITRGASPRPIQDWITDDLNGIPWVKISDATASKTRFIKHTSERIKQEGISKSVSVVPGDLIVSNSATPGLPKFIDINACIHDGWLLIREFEGIDKEFLYYLLINDRKYLVSQGTGTVFTNLKTDILKNHIIQLPTISVQKTIASFLSKLDSKIELNQKMNETLEEIAKTLFKSWFIDFDPVRAKAEGRPTGLPKEISDLFPDSFDDSELGDIPRGWSKSIITDIANKISDKYKKDEDWSNEKLIDLSRMPSNSISLNSHGRGDELSTSVCKFKKYDFLFGSIRPYFYKAGICPYDGVSNTSVFILRAKKSYDKEFMYFYSSSDVTFERSVQYSDGTKMPIIKWNDYKEFPFALPNEELRKQFSSIINPIVDKIILNIYEQKVLSELRDTLLPKLISGELKIPDAENLLEEAGI